MGSCSESLYTIVKKKTVVSVLFSCVFVEIHFENTPIRSFRILLKDLWLVEDMVSLMNCAWNNGYASGHIAGSMPD